MSFSQPQSPRNRRFRFFRAFSALILREMETTYGRSPGGYLWAILEPVAAIAVMSVVFSLLLRSPSLGTNFPLFYASGYLPYGLYMSASTQMAASIRYSKPLLGYPSVTFLDALLARLALTLLTQSLVFAIVMTGIIQYYDLKLILDWPAIFGSMGLALAMAVGVGSMNCFLTSSYPLWQRVWGIMNRPLFILSAILFIPEDVPAQFRYWLMLNPLAHVTTEMRKGFFATYDAVYVQPFYVLAIAITLAIFGLLFLLKNHKEIVLK